MSQIARLNLRQIHLPSATKVVQRIPRSRTADWIEQIKAIEATLNGSLQLMKGENEQGQLHLLVKEMEFSNSD